MGVFSKWYWKNWASTCQSMSLDTDFIPFMIIESQLVTDLNVKWKTIKILEDLIGENLGDLGFGDTFLATIIKEWSMKWKIDKLVFIKIKNFSSAKQHSLKRMKRQAIG